MSEPIEDLEGRFQAEYDALLGQGRAQLAAQVERCLRKYRELRAEAKDGEAWDQLIYAKFYIELLKRHPK